MKIAGVEYVLTASRSLRESDAAARVIRQGLIAGAAAGLAAALLFGIALSARLVRRLRRLRVVALAVGEDRPGATVPDDRRHDEVGSLTRALGTMRSRLQHQEHARRTFVATASHELRTPLASLGMTLELLEEDLADEDPDLAGAREEVRSARAQSQRLSGLARDLLDLSRLDSEVPLRAEPVELGELCRAVLAEFGPAARGRDVTLRSDGPPEDCWALGDPGAVARIVRILVENGLRFAPPGTALEVTIAGSPGQPALDVADRGPGVPLAERERIFRRFERGSDTGGEGGFGLGLAIARELAQRMGGALVLVDAPVGARMRLTLPAADPAPE
jgi:signal transduction histidine kinase